ncbi:MAG: CPBP family intramembrane glutamic endopeptidase [Bacteroidota bacterium]
MHHRYRFFYQAWKGDTRGYLYVIGLLLIILANVLVSFVYPIVAGFFVDDYSSLTPNELLQPERLGMPPALGLMLLLLPFAAGLFAIWIAIKYIHRRSFTSVLTGNSQLNWRKVGIGAGVWIGITLVFELIVAFMNPENYTYTFDAAKFFPTLIVALIFVPLQTSMEEVLFRGYLMQGIGKQFKRPLVALLSTSIMFGLLHAANPEIVKFGPILLLYYIGFGLMMGVLTIMDEGLELPLGIHAGNNLYGALIITFPSSALQTPAIFTLKEYPIEIMTLVWLIGSVIFILLMARLYQWKDWSKLTGMLTPPLSSTESAADHQDGITSLPDKDPERSH